jgi:acetoacetyl-CoA synthetase
MGGAVLADDAPPLLWEPSPEVKRRSHFARYLAWLERERGLRFAGYHDAQEWSATHIEEFWASLWDFFAVKAAEPYETVLASRGMPGARWFPGARLNYAENALRHDDDGHPALLFASELRPLEEVSWAELRRRVAAVAASLRAMGVGRGDRVAAYLPNIPEAVVGLLASASIGAVWSSCSPDFGVQGAVERFQQIEPSVLIAVDGYVSGGKRIGRRAEVATLRQQLPSLRHTVLVPYLDPDARLDGAAQWGELLGGSGPLEFEAVPFDHPLWVLYTSGTTGPPKAIVHGHGGIVLEHLKAHALQRDVGPGDRLFWFTTTGWMMWNLLVGGLLTGCTVVLYDGSPAYPDLHVLWRIAQDARITHFGVSASFFATRTRARVRPGDRFDLGALRVLGATGSPLSPEGFRWIYDAVKRDVWLATGSGGTDVCTGLVGACPYLPVHEGELQGRALGVAAHAFDEAGRPVVGQVGELVLTEPLPSMPLFFWNDPDGARYRESYFDTFPGVWRHGDLVRFTERGSAVIHGRSDSTLNRLGVRIGTSEIYRTVEAMPEVLDSLVVGLELPEAGYYMPLFVVPAGGAVLDDALRARIRDELRTRFSRWHVPDEIVAVPAVPRTMNGKKVEVPVKRILQGEPAGRVVSPGSLANPEALDFFVDFAARLRDRPGG